MKLFLFAILALGGVAADATPEVKNNELPKNPVLITGKIGAYDCSRLAAKPVGIAVKNDCVVAISGEASGVTSSGKKWTATVKEMVTAPRSLQYDILGASMYDVPVVMQVDLNYLRMSSFEAK